MGGCLYGGSSLAAHSWEKTFLMMPVASCSCASSMTSGGARRMMFLRGRHGPDVVNDGNMRDFSAACQGLPSCTCHHVEAKPARTGDSFCPPTPPFHPNPSLRTCGWAW